jgi:hypothetical protein
MVTATHSSDEAWLWPRCAETTTLIAPEISALRALPDLAGPPPKQQFACELAARHHDLHTAFLGATDGGERWWWIRWNVHHRELRHLEICNRTDQQSEDDCLLPAEHPGRHSFEM